MVLHTWTNISISNWNFNTLLSSKLKVVMLNTFCSNILYQFLESPLYYYLHRWQILYMLGQRWELWLVSRHMFRALSYPKFWPGSPLFAHFIRIFFYCVSYPHFTFHFVHIFKNSIHTHFKLHFITFIRLLKSREVSSFRTKSRQKGILKYLIFWFLRDNFKEFYYSILFIFFPLSLFFHFFMSFILVILFYLFVLFSFFIISVFKFIFS